jgi:SNF2 family DNA or RNA helicase
MIVDYSPKKEEFLLTAAPHIIMFAKRIWPEVSRQYGTIKITATQAHAVDLDWFLMRYALPLTEAAQRMLNALLSVARAREAAAQDAFSITGNSLPAGLELPLREYQAQAFELTKAMRSLLLGDAMGLGKTAVGIALSVATEGFAVVICQTHVQIQWMKQFAKFAPFCTVEIAKTLKPHQVNSKVLILPYSKCSGWAQHLLNQAAVVVLDECQELRNDSSGKYRAVEAICRHRPITIGLSGTPVYNYGGEIFNILEIITPGCLGSRSEFFDSWCTFSGSHWVVKEPDALGAFLAEQRLFLRRRAVDVQRELPPVQRLAHTVEYDSKIMSKMTGDADQLARTILTGAFTEKGQAARQLSIKLRQATGIAKAPFVAEFVAQLCLSGEKVVLAGWHREVYSIWQRVLAQNQVPSFIYTGTESNSAKELAVKGFTQVSGGACFILSLRSGAGLDGLQHVCQNVVIGELDWSPQVIEQVITRVHRDGQKENCTVFYLVSEAGSDPVVAGIIGVKQEQGHGITDPTIPFSDTPAASTFDAVSDDFGAKDTNRAHALATAWLSQKKK